MHVFILKCQHVWGKKNAHNNDVNTIDSPIETGATEVHLERDGGDQGAGPSNPRR